MTLPDRRPSPPPGLVTGGRGGPDDELLADGQEEVFSRSEVELGRIEHDTSAGTGSAPERGTASDTGQQPDRPAQPSPARRHEPGPGA